MKSSKAKIISSLIAILLTTLPVKADEKIDGHWEGNLTIMGNELKILVDIASEKEKIKATIDIPQQGAKGLTLDNIIYHDPTLHLELASPLGTAFMDGKVDNDKITGNFTQGGYSGIFNLQRMVSVKEVKKVEQLPYREENVSFKNGDATLAGTLTLPEKKGNYPAIVMITGSGPQNRNEEVFGFEIFKIIADHLTRKGFAVLRFDDRGVAESKGGDLANSTSQDFSGDAGAGVEFLLKHPEIDKKRIGLFGHSEGGIIAPMLAQQSKNISFLVLMAGTAETGEQILLEQSALIMRAGGSSEEEINDSNSFQKKVFQAMKTNTGWLDLEKELKVKIVDNINKLPAEARAKIKDTDKYAADVTKQTLDTYKSKWFRYFLSYDPYPVLAKTTIPVLAIFGGKDLQVPAKTNAPLMEKALKQAGNKNYTIKILPEANHLFQSSKSGSPNEYATLDKKFVPEFLDLISDWLININK